MMSDQVNIFNLYLENAANQEPEMRIDKNGTKKWFLNNRMHREDGAAIEYADGGKWWYLHGEPHREHAPAFEHPNGTKMWWLHGKRHREDGAAIEWPSGKKEWYLQGHKFADAESWAAAALRLQHKPATPHDVQQFLRSIYKKKSLL